MCLLKLTSMIIGLLLQGVILHLERSNTYLFAELCFRVSEHFPCEYFKERDKNFEINAYNPCH